MVVALSVQWGDQDAFEHVNNTVYFRWFESARIAYMDRIGLKSPTDHQPVGPILASIQCDFRRQLTYPDTVRIGARITRIGRTSIGMQHRVWSDALRAVAAEGDSTLVAFDYQAGRPHPVPEAIRAAISKLESTVTPS